MSLGHRLIVSLHEILATGRIGPLQLGLTRDEVYKLLGKCEAWSLEDGSEQKAKVWKYGILELWFRNNRVSYIGLYPELELELPENMSITGYFPTPTSNLAEFEQYLRQEYLSFVIDESFSKDFGTKMIIESKVNVIFHENNKIHSIYVLD